MRVVARSAGDDRPAGTDFGASISEAVRTEKALAQAGLREMGLARRDGPGGAGDLRAREVTFGIAGAERDIGRRVLATTDAGAVVWSATWYPFGGGRVTQGMAAALRFPGQ